SIDVSSIELVKLVLVTGLPSATGLVRQPGTNESAAPTAAIVTPETILRDMTFLLKEQRETGAAA
ncbi:MAG: hypothetical protein ACREJ3_04645, partial [Polyangiaceae bacterium]